MYCLFLQLQNKTVWRKKYQISSKSYIKCCLEFVLKFNHLASRNCFTISFDILDILQVNWSPFPCVMEGMSFQCHETYQVHLTKFMVAHWFKTLPLSIWTATHPHPLRGIYIDIYVCLLPHASKCFAFPFFRTSLFELKITHHYFYVELLSEYCKKSLF